jgi:enterochelin esterase family protein
MPDSPQSPRLDRLRGDLDTGNRGPLDAFWAEVTHEGAPLVEPVEGESDHSLVTFLWREQEQEPVTNVVVVSPLGGFNPCEIGPYIMSRLVGTDVWYLTYAVRDDLRTTYQFSVNDPLRPWDEIDWGQHSARLRLDPLNPRKFDYHPDPDNPRDKGRAESVVELPGAAPQPWIIAREGTARGRVDVHHLPSRLLGNTRRVQVYTPAGYDKDSPSADPGAYDLLVMFDGWGYTRNMAASTTLDNLIADGRIPPTVALFVDSPDRNLELPCYPPFARFLAEELLPWARAEYRFTGDPSHSTVGGASYGALAATFAALNYPELFGRVLCQSGAFWWKPEGDTEHELLARRFADAPRLPLRFHLDVGLLEQWPGPDGAPHILITNRHMRNVLRARGYPVSYMELNSGHDDVYWRGALADGLMALAGTD